MSKKKSKLNPDFNTSQRNAIKHFLGRGYINLGDSSIGIQLARIDREGYVLIVAIDQTGRVQQYKPTKPTPYEKARLNTISNITKA